MAEPQMLVVTDGSIGLLESVAQRYGVVVVPRWFAARWHIIQTPDASPITLVTERRLTGRKVYRVKPVFAESFVAAFGSLEAGCHLISVHAASVFDNCYYQARIARTILGEENRVCVYQSATMGTAVSFLVEAVAAFVQTAPTVPEQAVTFLQRLEHEMFTLLLASGPGKLACGWQSGCQRWKHWWRGLLGANAYSVSQDRSRLEPLDGWPVHFGWQPPTAQACDVLIEAFPSRTQATRLVRQLARLGFVRQVDVRRSVVAAANLPRSFLGVHFLPTPEKVHQIGLWVRRRSESS